MCPDYTIDSPSKDNKWIQCNLKPPIKANNRSTKLGTRYRTNEQQA